MMMLLTIRVARLRAKKLYFSNCAIHGVITFNVLLQMFLIT